MDNDRKKTCSECGAKTVRYKHGLSVGLVTGLRAIASVGACRLSELLTDRNLIDNFQKLRYWGFVIPEEEAGVRKSGWWTITNEGRQFLAGEPAFRYVWTYRGEPVDFDGDIVTIDQVEAGYRLRPDYAREAVPA